MLSSILLGHLKARGEQHKVASLTLLVTMLDTDIRSIWNLFSSPALMRRMATRSRRKGIVNGHTLERTFSWLKPNELVWIFFTNNYLMGNQPPAFDFLYWNNDSTRLPGCFHADLMTLYRHNPLTRRNGMKILNSTIDLKNVDCDCFLMAGIGDHIVPWQACYKSTQILDGDMEFVLSTSGHIQSVVNQPGKARTSFYTNRDYVADPEQWLEKAEQHEGSWWPHWLEWAGQRSGGSKPAPRWLGNARYRPGTPAPGRYVHQR
jgi:polyhydroxyalkanoate synthase